MWEVLMSFGYNGNIPHSQASIEKAMRIYYEPQYDGSTRF